MTQLPLRLSGGSHHRHLHASSVDEALHCVGVAGTLHLDSGRCCLDLGQVSGGEFEVGGGEVLLESAELAGARDRDDPRLLR